jgi:aryl-alcohol dehydrogenase-like predicted oxidoreductase
LAKYQNFLKQLDETSQHIGEYVNLYQVHSATFESGILTDERAHEALNECKKSKGWSIGLSVSGPNQNDILREAMKIKSADGSRLFDSVQCTYNVLEQRPGEALMEAHISGMDIVIKEGMANGRVFQSEKMQQISSSTDYSIDEIALACILCQPFNGRVLSGAVTSEQLVSNMKALELAEKLSGEENGLLNDIMENCKMESESYWQDRAALAWN